MDDPDFEADDPDFEIEKPSVSVQMGQPQFADSQVSVTMGEPSFESPQPAPSGPEAPALSLYDRAKQAAWPVIKESVLPAVVPGVAVGRALEQFGNVARKGINAAADWNMSRFSPEELKTGAPQATETIGRAILSPLTGSKTLDEQPEERQFAGVGALESALGETGATAALTTASMAGQVPTMLLGFGWAKKGEAVAETLQVGGKVLPKILKIASGAAGSALEGGVTSAGQAAFAGDDPLMGATAGAAFGGAAHGAGSLLPLGAKALTGSKNKALSWAGKQLTKPRLLKGYEPRGVIFPETVEGVADEIGDGLDSTVVRPGSLKPSAVVLTASEGKLVARVSELSQAGNKHYDIPVRNLEDAVKVQKLADANQLAIVSSQISKPLVADLPADVYSTLRTRPAREVSGTAAETPSSKDEVLRSFTPGMVIHADAAGHTKLQPVELPPPDMAAPAQMGDKVWITRGGGKQPAIFVGTTKGGQTIVLMAGPGKPAKSMGDVMHSVSAHDLILADPAEHTAAVQKMVDRAAQVDVQSTADLGPKNPGDTAPIKGKGRDVELTNSIHPSEIGNGPAAPALPPVEPKPSRPFKKGELGYLANAAGDGYVNVEIHGPGKTPDTVLVKANEGGAVIEVPASRVDRELPPGIADYADAAPATPDAPPPPDASSFPPEVVDQHNIVNNIYARMAKTGLNAWDKITRALISGQARGPKELALMVQMKQGAQAIMKAEADHLAFVKSQLPKHKLLSSFDVDLGRVAEGKLPMAEFENQYGQKLSAELKEYTKSFLTERGAKEQRIVSLGGLPESIALEHAAGLTDPYLARMYWVNLLPPGKWAKMVPGDVFNNAVAELAKQMGEGGKIVVPSEIAAELAQILKAGNVAEMIRAGGSPTARAMNKLLARKDIAPAIRKVMGEVESGAVRIAATTAAQDSIIATLELFQSIDADPNLSNMGPRTDLHPEPVPDSKRLFGKLAGKYVRPEIYREIITLPQTIHNNFTFAHAISGWLKGNQVPMNLPIAFVNSVMGNFQSAIYSGGGSLTRPKQWGKDLFSAWKAVRDYHADPSGRTGDGWLVREAKKMGTDWAGYGEAEISPASRKFVNQVAQELEKKKGRVDLYTVLGTVKRFSIDKYRDAQAFLGSALDAQDRTFRLASYIALRREFKSKGMPDLAAAKEAAHRIAQYYWNPQHVGPAIQKLRNSVGIGAPYLTAAAEDARVIGTAFYNSFNGKDPGLKWRVLSNAAIMGGIAGAGGLLRHLNGIRKEDIDLAHQSMTKRQQAYRPGVMVLPWRDDQGRVQMIDVTQYFLPLRLLSGHPDDSWYSRMAQNLGTMPVEGSLAGAAVEQSLETAGIKRPLPDRDMLEGERNLIKWIDMAWRMGFGPKYVQTAMDVARRTQVPDFMLRNQEQAPGFTRSEMEPITFGPGKLGRNEEPLTPGQAATMLLGGKVQPTGDRSYRAAKKEKLGEMIHLLKSQLKQDLTSNRSPEEKQEIKKKILERVKTLTSQLKEQSAAKRALQESKQSE